MVQAPLPSPTVTLNPEGAVDPVDVPTGENFSGLVSACLHAMFSVLVRDPLFIVLGYNSLCFMH